MGSAPANDPVRRVRPVVVYIAGSGRSGSTLVERMLGAMPGFVNVGELIDLLRRPDIDTQRCGCGLALAVCPFWTAVGRRAFGGGLSSPPATRLRALQPRVARHRHLLRLLAPIPGRTFPRDLRSYQDQFASLYRAILAESGARYVVDASKWPSQAHALAGSAIDLRVVHLVRDPRGVAHSLSRVDQQRPHSLRIGDVMAHRPPARAAAMWTAAQAEVDLLRLRGVPVAQLRYEDIVGDARAALEAALRDLDLGPSADAFDHLHRDSVDLGPSHGVAGNPSRFASGPLPLRLDEAWRREMPVGSRAVVSALALPYLLATGHLGRRGARPHPSLPVEPGPPPPWTAPPLVSVVLPTRGRPELVRDSIAAVVAQTYAGSMECLVVHDQEAADLGLAELGTAQHTVRVLNNTHAGGLAGARNTGLDAAKGDFVATCDDDDVWHPDKIERQLQLLHDEPDLLVVGSGIRLLFPAGRVVEWPGRSTRIDQRTLLTNRVKELHSSTLLMRRDAFAKAGRYDEHLPHGYGEDYDWILRAARVGRIGVVIEPLADIRKDVQSWFRERTENTAEALVYLLDHHPELTASRRGHARILGQIGYAQACLGQRRPALRTAARSLGRYPAAPYAYLALAQAVLGVSPAVVLKAARVFRRGLS